MGKPFQHLSADEIRRRARLGGAEKARAVYEAKFLMAPQVRKLLNQLVYLLPPKRQNVPEYHGPEAYFSKKFLCLPVRRQGEILERLAVTFQNIQGKMLPYCRDRTFQHEIKYSAADKKRINASGNRFELATAELSRIMTDEFFSLAQTSEVHADPNSILSTWHTISHRLPEVLKKANGWGK
ncbi:Uncharacterised protein [uncultured archaeon]|nr:Uncharacterised protein [uncultured archaeon]